MHKLDRVHKTRHGTDNALSPVGRYAFTLMLLAFHHLRNWKQFSFGQIKTIFIKGNRCANVVCKMSAILSECQYPFNYTDNMI